MSSSFLPRPKPTATSALKGVRVHQMAFAGKGVDNAGFNAALQHDPQALFV